MTDKFDEIYDIVLEIMKYPEDIRPDLATADIIRIAHKPKKAMWPNKRR